MPILGAQSRLGIGDHDTARQCFAQTAAGTDVRVRAEARYNAYHTLLEQADAGGALVELLGAAELDPERFAPFPTDKYEPQRILGWGGFGVAVLCRHSVTRRPLIVKAIRNDGLDFDPADVVAEAQALEDLSHDAIIRLRDCQYADAARTRPYLVMDFFDGLTLADYVEMYGKIPADEFLPLADLIAKGLHYAHTRPEPITHRDVKPGNLLVRKDGPVWAAKWIDFGLAVRDTAAAPAGTDKPANTSGRLFGKTRATRHRRVTSWHTSTRRRARWPTSRAASATTSTACPTCWRPRRRRCGRPYRPSRRSACWWSGISWRRWPLKGSVMGRSDLPPGMPLAGL